jgi:hypothetical protein
MALVIFAISVCKTPIRKGDSHGDRKERKGTDEPPIEGSPNPNRSNRFLRCPCVKLRSERGIHTEIAKNAKERTNHRSTGTQFESVLVIFAISVCKTPIRKAIYTENAKERTNHGSQGHSTRMALVIFAISVCKTPIRKGDPHGDRKERKGTDDHGSKGHPVRIGS